mgnify:CR=1 FL=1
MEDNYSIDEILSAVDDLQNLKSNKTKKVSSVSNTKTNNSDIPKNTLRLIEEASSINLKVFFGISELLVFVFETLETFLVLLLFKF